jgi:hypothetical protein
LQFLQLTFVVTGTTGLLLDGIFALAWNASGKNAMHMFEMLISGSEVI